MLIQQLNRTDAEKVFGAFKNISGSSMAADIPAFLDTGTPDGNRITSAPAAGANQFVVGLVDSAISNNDFGLVQTYGYRATSSVFRTNTSIAIGAKLAPVASQSYLATFAAGDGKGDGMFAVMETVQSSAASTTASAKIHIRCM